MIKLPKVLEQTIEQKAEAKANEFYHAQGDIYQVMPWSDCKESAKTVGTEIALEVLKQAEKVVTAATRCLPPEAYSEKAEGTAVGKLVKALADWQAFIGKK